MKGRWIGSIVLVAVCIAFQQGCGMKREPPPAKEEIKTKDEAALITLKPEAQRLAEIAIEEVTLRSIQTELHVPGTIQPNESRLAHVGSRIPGRIVEVVAVLGDPVEKGQKLAVIDSPELGQVQLELLTARTRSIVAQKAYERAKALVEGKVIGTGEFQRREGEYLSSKAEAQAAEDRLGLLGMTENEIKSLGGENIARSQVAILAPLAGRVIERHVAIGEVVEPVKTLFTIADLTILWGIADIPEKDLSKIKKGLTTEVSVAAYPEEHFKGKITYLSDSLDPSSRTLKVRVEVDNSKGKLKPEMFASFRILTEETEKALAVPKSAVQREGNQTIVFVAHEEKGFEKRVVELDREGQGYYKIVSGLKLGERIVTRGAFTLKSEALKNQMEAE